MPSLNLMLDKANTGAGEWIGGSVAKETRGVRSVQAGVLGSGAVSATVRIWGANDTRFPVKVVDFTISGTDVASDATDLSFPWEFYRAEVIAISGNKAAVSAVMKV